MFRFEDIPIGSRFLSYEDVMRVAKYNDSQGVELHVKTGPNEARNILQNLDISPDNSYWVLLVYA